MTWGIEGTVIERFGGAGVAPGKVTFARETYIFNAPVSSNELVATFRDERIRRGQEERPGRGAADGSGTLFSAQNPEREPERDLDPGDVPARLRDGLKLSSR